MAFHENISRLEVSVTPNTLQTLSQFFAPCSDFNGMENFLFSATNTPIPGFHRLSGK